MACNSVYYSDVKRLFLSVLLSVLLFAGCDPHPHFIGGPAPDFTVKDSDRTISLHELKGKPVILNFWASWCKPCVDEMPSLVRLQKQMGNKVTIFAVSWDEDDRAYHKFLQDYHVDLLTVRDADQHSRTLYRATGQPETYIIDASGTIRRKFIGAVDWTSQDIVDYLNKL
jgi:cytochrome c biogenesis protein CcmG, thiol:disulfide interchange protein DsbE